VPALDSLPPDQRAVLTLVLGQGKTYDELAALLKIDREAVRSRARAAVEALGPSDGEKPPIDRRGAIADYLLGQQPVSQRAATRARLESSPGDRAWARVVAAELRQLARDGLPEIPAEGAEVDEAFDALKARTVAREHAQRSSKLGGVLLLAGVGVVLAVALVIVLGGGGDDDEANPATSRPPTTATGGQATEPLAQVNLTPPRGNSRALGVAQIVRRDGQLGVVIRGQNIPPSSRSFAYAVWLYNSPRDAARLGFVSPGVGKDGRLVAISGLPANLPRFRRLIVTRETSSRPAQPGPIVLTGSLSLRR
jgi:hypothetical protein